MGYGESVTIRLGYQIPNFTYEGVPVEKTFDTVVAQAKEAEASGFDTVLVMDHFYQLPASARPRTRCWRPTPRWARSRA